MSRVAAWVCAAIAVVGLTIWGNFQLAQTKDANTHQVCKAATLVVGVTLAPLDPVTNATPAQLEQNRNANAQKADRLKQVTHELRGVCR